jgi:transposase
MASITYDKVVSIQITEGSSDSVIFENFLYRTLNSFRQNPKFKDKHIIILMDNATIHKRHTVFETAQKMNASILFNA